MKRIIAVLLSFVLILSGCGNSISTESAVVNENPDVKEAETTVEPVTEETTAEVPVVADEIAQDAPVDEFDDGLGDVELDFNGLNDPELLQYVEDNIYAGLEAQLASDDYIIEGVDAIFISKEYLEENEYNSQSNIYFGYTLEELDEQFQGTRYVFTLDDDGQTTVEPFEDYDDTYNQVIKNVAIGSGVILICVTVSTVATVAGAPACVSMVFAASAKTGASMALSSGVVYSVAAGTMTAIQTDGDIEAAFKAAAVKGSEAFKMGAIVGAIAGGAAKALELSKSTPKIPDARTSEKTVLKNTKNGVEQVSYLKGKEVPLATKGATRPDVVVRNADGSVRAIEVKNYNLANVNNRRELYLELERQIADRVKNLPKGSTQEIVLDVRGRNFSEELIEMVIRNIRLRCDAVYPNIPVEILT